MKILYNVTVIIDHSVAKEWKEWMVQKHIPDVMNTGIFESYQMQRILSGENPDGITYAIQYLTPSMEKYEEYQSVYAPKLQDEHTQKYNGKFGAFRTLMEVVSAG